MSENTAMKKTFQVKGNVNVKIQKKILPLSFRKKKVVKENQYQWPPAAGKKPIKHMARLNGPEGPEL